MNFQVAKSKDGLKSCKLIKDIIMNANMIYIIKKAPIGCLKTTPDNV